MLHTLGFILYGGFVLVLVACLITAYFDNRRKK